jgi:hypothetical protein
VTPATAAAALATAPQPAGAPAAFNNQLPPPAWAAVNNPRPPLVGTASQAKVSGQIEVSFKDAPPGMRVEPVKGQGDVPVNVNVGYRSYALGMP